MCPQLVLLSADIVGQNVLAAPGRRSAAPHDDANAMLHEAVKVQDRLRDQGRRSR